MDTKVMEEAVKLPLHPYYPLGVSIPNYVANDMTTLEILAYFGAGCSAVLLFSYFVLKRVRPGLSTSELSTAMWFIFSGSIHLGMEGYVVYNSAEIAGLQTLLGQAWKEYSRSDSRYLTQDNFVITMEAITAIFWGPLCFAVAYCIAADHPLRHPFQLIVSLGQIYGDVLYYATCAFDHHIWQIVYCVPENFYFWCYFMLMNAFWIVIPFPLLVQSVNECKRAFAKVKQLENSRKKN